jgi:hypothetical protein
MCGLDLLSRRRRRGKNKPKGGKKQMKRRDSIDQHPWEAETVGKAAVLDTQYAVQVLLRSSPMPRYKICTF